MTASNLGICIGCSLLYPKDQSASTPASLSYTNSSSLIVELMITNHKLLFPSNDQQETPKLLYQMQPDLIPTVNQNVNYFFIIIKSFFYLIFL
jgi:hypothetical protein